MKEDIFRFHLQLSRTLITNGNLEQNRNIEIHFSTFRYTSGNSLLQFTSISLQQLCTEPRVNGYLSLCSQHFHGRRVFWETISVYPSFCRSRERCVFFPLMLILNAIKIIVLIMVIYGIVILVIVLSTNFQ